jgi:hypothetical protein
MPRLGDMEAALASDVWRAVPAKPLAAKRRSMHMTTQNFLIALGVGSALIAFWCVARFPERCPEDFPRALLHVAMAFMIGWAAPDLFNAVVAEGYTAALAGIFFILLPVLFYTFLSGAWFIKLTHETISRYRN